MDVVDREQLLVYIEHLENFLEHSQMTGEESADLRETIEAAKREQQRPPTSM